MKEKPRQVELQNRRGRAINLLLLGVGTYWTVKFGLQLLGQHRRL